MAPEHTQMSTVKPRLVRNLHPREEAAAGAEEQWEKHRGLDEHHLIELSVCESVSLPGLAAVTVHVSGSVFIVLGLF